MARSQEMIEKGGNTMERIESPKKYKWLRFFDDDSSQIPISDDLLGGKGAGLARLVEIAKKEPKLNVRIPPGFTLTTETFGKYEFDSEIVEQEIIEETDQAIEELGEKTDRKFGSKTNPLLVSCRSGAMYSMPGMMRTFLNIGINDETLPQTEAIYGPVAALSAYARLIEGHGVGIRICMFWNINFCSCHTWKY